MEHVFFSLVLVSKSLWMPFFRGIRTFPHISISHALVLDCQGAEPQNLRHLQYLNTNSLRSPASDSITELGG